MFRTDRLFEIIHLLRRANGPVTAAQLAQDMEVSTRTIYRNIASLQAMRIPIEGAVGIGYVLRGGYDLPPLNFSSEEIEALIVGMGMLARTGDRGLQNAARRVLSKVDTADVSQGSLQVSEWGIGDHDDAQAHEHGRELRRVIAGEQEVKISYRALDDTVTERRIWPLVLTYYVEVAVVSGWCVLRQDFRAFRIDRISEMSPTGEVFTGQGQELRARMEAQSASVGAR